VLHPITLYFLCFAPQVRRHSARYLARALGRPTGWRDSYRHLYCFAAVVLDRIWFVSGHMDVFELPVTGNQWVDETLAEGRGAFLLGAHIGSFEALHAIGDTLQGLRVAMVMYPHNAQKIHSVLQAIAPNFELGIIAIGQRGSTLAIRDWLDSGGLAGLLGDRFLPSAHGRPDDAVEVNFLGAPARFTIGPLRLAMLLKRKVIFMVGLYGGGKRYDVRFDLLADFSQPPADPAERDRQVIAALHRYVERLESLCREAPYNWFNFYDFWHEDAASGTH
jgi:predicted LPLAT superfamily acyltransferase